MASVYAASSDAGCARNSSTSAASRSRNSAARSGSSRARVVMTMSVGAAWAPARSASSATVRSSIGAPLMSPPGRSRS